MTISAKSVELSVGTDGDIVGATDQAIQQALDRVAEAGGGSVRLLPGSFVLRNSVRVPSNSRLYGSGEKTILRKGPGWEMSLWEDGDWGDCWIRCTQLPPVRIGDGVWIGSNVQSDWHSTVGTVLEIDGPRFRISRVFNSDYMVADGGRASSAHPLIALEDVSDVTIQDLVIEGERDHNPHQDGCRGGGIWAYRARDVQVRGVVVRGVNGDAISFQKSDDWVVEDCITERNTGNGFHPGTNAMRPVIRNCISRHNSGWGLFVCWQVKNARFEGNLLEHNTAGGISNGHKDTDNLFTGNQIRGNAGPAIFSRDETFPMAPHRCIYEKNTIRGNNRGGPQIVIEGEVHDLVFRNNDHDPKATRFQVGPKAVKLTLDNQT